MLAVNRTTVSSEENRSLDSTVNRITRRDGFQRQHEDLTRPNDYATLAARYATKYLN